MQELTNFMSEAWRTLTDSFVLKALLAVIADVAIYMIGLKHVQVLGIFILLVFLDLITKWAAISYQMLIDMGANADNLTALDKYIAIPAAWGKGIIFKAYAQAFRYKSFNVLPCYWRRMVL